MKISDSANELIISIPKGVFDIQEIQDFIDLLRYKFIVSKSKASSQQIQELTDEINEELGDFNSDKVQ
jgi:hypothetical protein